MEGFGNAECKMQSAECRRHNKPLSSSAMPKPLSPKGDSYQNAEFTPSGREPYTLLAEEGGPLAVEGVFKMHNAECRISPFRLRLCRSHFPLKGTAIKMRNLLPQGGSLIPSSLRKGDRLRWKE